MNLNTNAPIVIIKTVMTISRYHIRGRHAMLEVAKVLNDADKPLTKEEIEQALITKFKFALNSLDYALRTMINKGFVRKRDCLKASKPDTRIRIFHLTPKGKRHYTLSSTDV